MGVAHRFDDRPHTVAGLVADRAGMTEAEIAAAQEHVVVAIGQSATQSLSVRALTRACNAEALMSLDRKQACDAAATTLAERSDSLLASTVGAVIGRRVGWSEERVDAVRALQEAQLDAWSVGARTDPLRLTARVEFDERDNIFVGRILGIRTMISFHGETVAQLRGEFEAAIEDFVRECKQKGLRPEKPASGKLLLRVPPEVHGAAMVAAQAAGKSLNQWATELLRDAVHH